MDLLEGLKESEKRDFRRITNKLLSTCFVSKKSNRQDYRFIRRNKALFRDYFEIGGYRLEENDEYGIFQLVNFQGYNRKLFTLNESIVLLILRILYDENRRELTQISDAVTSVGDIQDMYEAVRDGKKITKTEMRNVLMTLKRFNIIEFENVNDILTDDVPLIILDTILMAVPLKDIRESHTMLERYSKSKIESERLDLVK